MINQFSASLDIIQDRVFFCFNTKKEQEFRLWLTRRCVSQFLETLPRYSEESKDIINELEKSVELKKTDQIKDYGVYMRVSYLPGQRVTQLNHSQHSGGEKRVATIMYLLALQKLNPSCPLRIVDEINQGMDAKNERKAFAALVENVCGKQNDERARRSGSQFFVITPKLLPNFEYRPEVTVLTVCNAKSMISSKGWDLDAFIKKEKATRNL